MEKIMVFTAQASQSRLEPFWPGDDGDRLTPSDVYSMQLLHSYDTVSGRASPWHDLFDPDDWAGFEYLRDVKYFYSEGYGRENTHLLAVPWMQAGLECVTAETVTSGRPARKRLLPLRIGFTHREPILYLACLLGINHERGWEPDLSRVDRQRRWRVAALAPYLGHIGLESYRDQKGDVSIRFVVNGEVESAFFDELERDGDGGYKAWAVAGWLRDRRVEYDTIYGAGDLTFLKDPNIG